MSHVLEAECAQQGWLLFLQGHTSWDFGSFPTILLVKAKWATEGWTAQLPTSLF